MALRLSFKCASRFIWSFICEYFLKDFRVALQQLLRHPLIRHAA
jgi:hypothetical protein